MPRQHQKMIDAVYQKNQKLAEKAVHDHITTALRIAIERL
jgi:DNA-binding GntR family transcriptional regulator